MSKQQVKFTKFENDTKEALALDKLSYDSTTNKLTAYSSSNNNIKEEVTLPIVDVDDTLTQQDAAADAKAVGDSIGTLNSLTTTTKTNVVSAINEIDSHADTNTNNIGTLNNLTTTAKSNIVAAINEVDAHADTNAASISDLNNQITELQNLLPYNSSWGKIQFLSRSGIASTYMSVGDQITDTYTNPDASSTTTYSQVWDVLDFRDVTLSDASTRHATIIGTHYTQLVSQQFSGWQALLYTETGLPAGTYNIEITTAWGSKDLVVGTYQFTLSSAVPAGGQIVGVKRWPDVTIDTWTVSTYSSYASTTTIETVSVTSGSDGTALGVVAPIVPTDTISVTIDGTAYTYRLNGYQQAAYGYNRWRDSAVRQYLNSDAAAGSWWTPQHVFDRAPDIASTKAGWLAGVPDDFKAALTPVKVLTAPPNAIASAEGITFDTTYDKVFLPSLEEHYIANQGTGEGDAYAYWKNINGTSTVYPCYKATDDLIVYQLANHSSAAYRWLRSAYRGAGCIAWLVSPSGSVTYGNAAHNSLPLAPACAIC